VPYVADTRLHPAGRRARRQERIELVRSRTGGQTWTPRPRAPARAGRWETARGRSPL